MKIFSLIIQGILILFLVVIILADLLPLFDYRDVPFFLFFPVYLLEILMFRSSDKRSFLIAFCFLILMSIMFIFRESSRTVERLGEWFFLTFAFALSHSIGVFFFENISRMVMVNPQKRVIMKKSTIQ